MVNEERKDTGYKDMKYKDKSYLAQYDLDIELFKKFDLIVNDVIPVRSVFILNTNKGNKVLKRITYSTEHLEFIQKAIDYISRNNFNRVLGFERTKEGDLSVLWGGSVYCIMNLIDGRECEYSNPVDIAIVSKGLAELHAASEGFRDDVMDNKCICGKTIENFRKKLDEIHFFKSMVSLYEYKNEFDEIFIENVEYYELEIKKSIDILEKSQYYKLCSEEDKIVLCHHDLAHHNIMINDEQAYFIDFDYAVIDLKVHDLCNLINKVVKNFAFDIEKAYAILENYSKINPLNEKELTVLYGMLTFPEDFYTIVRDYYTRKKQWSEEIFLYRLKRKVNYKEDREEFLKTFSENSKIFQKERPSFM